MLQERGIRLGTPSRVLEKRLLQYTILWSRLVNETKLKLCIDTEISIQKTINVKKYGNKVNEHYLCVFSTKSSEVLTDIEAEIHTLYTLASAHLNKRMIFARKITGEVDIASAFLAYKEFIINNFEQKYENILAVEDFKFRRRVDKKDNEYQAVRLKNSDEYFFVNESAHYVSTIVGDKPEPLGDLMIIRIRLNELGMVLEECAKNNINIKITDKNEHFD